MFEEYSKKTGQRKLAVANANVPVDFSLSSIYILCSCKITRNLQSRYKCCGPICCLVCSNYVSSCEIDIVILAAESGLESCIYRRITKVSLTSCFVITMLFHSDCIPAKRIRTLVQKCLWLSVSIICNLYKSRKPSLILLNVLDTKHSKTHSTCIKPSLHRELLLSTSEMSTSIQTVGVIGTGVIGASWTALFLAKGLHVIVSDPAPGAEKKLAAYLEKEWPVLERLGLASNASLSNYEFVSDIDSHLESVDFVQEVLDEHRQIRSLRY